MASFPGLCQGVGPSEEDGELDVSLQQMLKAIADERNRLSVRQEVSGLGESGSASDPGQTEEDELCDEEARVSVGCIVCVCLQLFTGPRAPNKQSV